MLSERSYSAVLQARGIFTLPNALTSGGAGVGGGSVGGVGGGVGGSVGGGSVGGTGTGSGGGTLAVSTSTSSSTDPKGTGRGVGGGNRSGGVSESGDNTEGGKKENQWLHSIMHMVGNSIGLSVAYFMQKTSVTFGGCMMGSEYLLQSFEELADPLLDRLALPTLKRTSHYRTLHYIMLRLLNGISYL